MTYRRDLWEAGLTVPFWSALESNINMAIWHFAGVYPAIGACMTEQIFTLDTRLKALASLVRLRRGPRSLLNRINKFSNVVRKAQTIRNRVAHHTWHQGLESKEISQLEIGARGTLTYGFKPIPITSLQADQETVRKAMAEAAAIREAAEAALPTLPEIPLEELQPTVLHSGGTPLTRSSDKTFLLFPPRPSDSFQAARDAARVRKAR